MASYVERLLKTPVEHRIEALTPEHFMGEYD